MPGRSRYDGAQVAYVCVEDGAGGEREVAYLRTRTPGPAAADLATGNSAGAPPIAGPPPIAWHRVAADDRLDLLAARYLGDPGASWRICDANLALDPDALVGPDAEGAVVVIPAPGV
jgi:hypothetical protein